MIKLAKSLWSHALRTTGWFPPRALVSLGFSARGAESRGRHPTWHRVFGPTGDAAKIRRDKPPRCERLVDRLSADNQIYTLWLCQNSY